MNSSEKIPSHPAAADAPCALLVGGFLAGNLHAPNSGVPAIPVAQRVLARAAAAAFANDWSLPAPEGGPIPADLAAWASHEARPYEAH